MFVSTVKSQIITNIDKLDSHGTTPMNEFTFNRAQAKEALEEYTAAANTKRQNGPI